MRERKTLNKPLLRKLALKLRRLRHEEHYFQGWWGKQTACGTAACIAGHAVTLEGWQLKVPSKEDIAAGYVDIDECRKGKTVEEIVNVAHAILGIPHERTADSICHPLFGPAPERDWEPFAPGYAARWLAVKEGASKERPSRIAADLLDAIADGKVTL